MSKIYAVALALVILAAPAMAEDLTSPYPQDLDINISVEPIAELWHGGNLESIDLAVRDAAAWFGESVPMTMNGNVAFNVDIEVDGTNIPDDVRLDIVTNENGEWDNWSKAIDGSDDRRYDPRYDYGGSGTTSSYLADFQSASDSHYFMVSNSSPDSVYNDGSLTRTEVWSYAGDRSVESISNVYALYAGFEMPAQTTAAQTVTVKYYISTVN